MKNEKNNSTGRENANVSRETNWRNWPKNRILQQAGVELGVNLSNSQVDGLLNYFSDLLVWNSKVNLIGPGEESEQIIIHLADSLAPLKYINEENLKVLDIGSGGGLPGMVLALLRPDWHITMAEPRAKKAYFIKKAARMAGLINARVVIDRVGAGNSEIQQATFDIVTFRGVGALKNVMNFAGDYLIPQGRMLAYKGPDVDRELDEAKDVMKSAALEVENKILLKLPLIDHERVILIIRKSR